jgi:hypothetical protein
MAPSWIPFASCVGNGNGDVQEPTHLGLIGEHYPISGLGPVIDVRYFVAQSKVGLVY